MIDLIEGSYDTLPIVSTFPSGSRSSAGAIHWKQDRWNFLGRSIEEGNCIWS